MWVLWVGRKIEVPLAILSSILAQSCVIPPYIFLEKGLRMIVLDSIAKGTSIFRMVHPYIAIQSNGFYTCIMYNTSSSDMARIYARRHIYTSRQPYHNEGVISVL